MLNSLTKVIRCLGRSPYNRKFLDDGAVLSVIKCYKNNILMIQCRPNYYNVAEPGFNKKNMDKVISSFILLLNRRISDLLVVLWYFRTKPILVLWLKGRSLLGLTDQIYFILNRTSILPWTLLRIWTSGELSLTEYSQMKVTTPDHHKA